MIDYKVVSMCISSSYCKGWNDAVKAIRDSKMKHNSSIQYKTVSICPSVDYCNGWNDAVKENKTF